MWTLKDQIILATSTFENCKTVDQYLRAQRMYLKSLRREEKEANTDRNKKFSQDRRRSVNKQHAEESFTTGPILFQQHRQRTRNNKIYPIIRKVNKPANNYFSTSHIDFEQNKTAATVMQKQVTDLKKKMG